MRRRDKVIQTPAVDQGYNNLSDLSDPRAVTLARKFGTWSSMFYGQLHSHSNKTIYCNN